MADKNLRDFSRPFPSSVSNEEKLKAEQITHERLIRSLNSHPIIERSDNGTV